jgi:hypothetical protein
MDQPEETPLARAERHVAEFEQRVNKQAALVDHLRATDSAFIADAERLLADFQTTLDIARDHLRAAQERHAKAP